MLLLAALTPEPGFRLFDAYVFACCCSAALPSLRFPDRGWHHRRRLWWRRSPLPSALRLPAHPAYRPDPELCLFRHGAVGDARPHPDAQGLHAVLAGLFTAAMVIEPDQVAFLGLIALGVIVLSALPSLRRAGVTWGRLVLLGIVALAVSRR